MPDVRSCGVIVFRRAPRSFLLMRHPDRWDLPKGHVDPGETDLQCALRELQEETGLLPGDVELDEHFCFETRYRVWDKRYPEGFSDKTLRIFLAWLLRDKPITPTEHAAYRWFPWHPPHQIQAATIDPLLAQLDEYFRARMP